MARKAFFEGLKSKNLFFKLYDPNYFVNNQPRLGPSIYAWLKESDHYKCIKIEHKVACVSRFFPLWKTECLKGQCHEIFWNFFIAWIEAIWAPDKQAKMVLHKSSFLRRNSRKIRLRAVLACAESNKFFQFSKTSISREI